MLKSCPKCGKIHDYNYDCKVAKRPPKTRTPDQKLRSTNKWKQKSIEIRDRSKWLCAMCLEEGRFNYDNLEVHHIVKLKDDEDGLLDDENLICLCKHHHELADAGKISAETLKKISRARENPATPPGERHG